MLLIHLYYTVQLHAFYIFTSFCIFQILLCLGWVRVFPLHILQHLAEIWHLAAGWADQKLSLGKPFLRYRFVSDLETINMTNCSFEDMGLQNSPEKVQSIWHTRFTVSTTVLDVSHQMYAAQNRKIPQVYCSPRGHKKSLLAEHRDLFNCFVFPRAHRQIPYVFDSGS